ncbi:hypothetical protein ONA70_30345 [Micromonospora yasonensis]|uniref:hypothetical protein n=1 Tax=Micromonospora yasonensis TaxID=1128667 RepID=UPI00222F3739|nr:hypothetical protein [Micromonospora yasonensis]MCW3844396.1 hypothetical protein [Micromonospora yasonensis]
MIDLAVDFPRIASYLRNSGWTPSVSGEIAEFWTRDEGLEVLVPKLPNAPDFDKRIELLTQDLQRIEDRPAQDIKNDITRQFLDITDVRADHEYGEQCIPLDAGHKLFTTARGLVVSATASTLQRRGYFGRSMPKKARDQAKRALVGHTRPGSYVVPIINNARLPDLPWEEEQPRLIESVEEAAFERRVATNLARALGALQEIAVVRESRPSNRDLHDAVGEGLSFEMCRAIVRPLQEEIVRKVDITFAWAPGVTPPRGVARAFEFPSERVDLLKDIAATLRRDPSNSEELIYGVVVGLRSRSGDDGGRVEVETLIDGAKRLVRLDLNESQYEVARACHKRSPVIARGTLHRNPGRMASMEVTNFEQDLSLPIEIPS